MAEQKFAIDERVGTPDGKIGVIRDVERRGSHRHYRVLSPSWGAQWFREDTLKALAGQMAQPR